MTSMDNLDKEIQNEKEKITADTSDYLKVFYRNSREKKEVIVKVLLENKDGKLLTIIKYLPKNYEGDIARGERKNKVPSSFDYLDTYIFNENKIEDIVDFSTEKKSENSEQKINDFFGLEDEKLSIKKFLIPLKKSIK